MNKQDSHLRSLIKGISWRITGTFDTIVIASLVTHDLSTALKIGAVEVFTKVALYYGHERVWQKIKWGQPVANGETWSKAKPAHDSPVRSLVKGISWRATGTVDTMLISYFITHDMSKAFAIGGVEIFTKLTLYYFHERVWQKVKWGQPKDRDAGSKTPTIGSGMTAVGS